MSFYDSIQSLTLHIARRCVIALMMVYLLGSSFTRGADVLVVLSSESKPYKLAADRCVSTLRTNGWSVRQIMLSEAETDQLKEQRNPVITIGGTAASRIAQMIPEDTLLYYCMTPHPASLGLLARENTSGISTDPDYAMHVELLTKSGMSIRKVGMIYNSSNTSSQRLHDELSNALPERWELVAIDLGDSGNGAKAIDMLFDRDIDLIWTAADPAVYNASLVKALLLRSIRERVPMFGFSHALVRAGAPFGAGFNPDDQGEQVAQMVKNRVSGTHRPADTVLAVNTTALDRINLKLSTDLMRLAEVRFGSD